METNCIVTPHFRPKAGIRSSMEPSATILIQKCSTLKLFQPAEIIPKRKPIEKKVM